MGFTVSFHDNSLSHWADEASAFQKELSGNKQRFKAIQPTKIKTRPSGCLKCVKQGQGLFRNPSQEHIISVPSNAQFIPFQPHVHQGWAFYQVVKHAFEQNFHRTTVKQRLRQIETQFMQQLGGRLVPITTTVSNSASASYYWAERFTPNHSMTSFTS